mmetsp:Transcript_18834/g.61504  ORF Transcript_18834/g.61504 Transcript_18834/m.61504 type:complete len:104 (-) Transcript_18834:136-447(-)
MGERRRRGRTSGARFVARVCGCGAARGERWPGGGGAVDGAGGAVGQARAAAVREAHLRERVVGAPDYYDCECEGGDAVFLGSGVAAAPVETGRSGSGDTAGRG